MSEAPTARIVRFGAGALAELGDVCSEAGIAGPLLVTTRRGAGTVSGLPVVETFDGVLPHVPVETVRAAAERVREAGADGLVGLGGGSAIDTCKAVVAELAAARDRAATPRRRRPDDVRGSRVDAVLRDAPRSRPEGRRRRRARAPGRGDLRPRAEPRAAARRDGRHGDERPRALRRGPLPPRAQRRRGAPRGDRRHGDRLRAAARRRAAGRDLRQDAAARGRDARRPCARRVGPLPRARDGAGAGRPLRAAAGVDERGLPSGGAPVQRGRRPGRRRPFRAGARRRRRSARASRSSRGSAASAGSATSAYRRAISTRSQKPSSSAAARWRTPAP